MKCSEGLETFLAFVRDCTQNYNIAADAENDANNATQDLLHAFELGTWDEAQIIKMSHALTKVRGERRQAKDARCVYELVVSWAAENDDFLKGLSRLLGEVRKAERGTEGRLYHNKTDVMTDIAPDANFTPIRGAGEEPALLATSEDIPPKTGGRGPKAAAEKPTVTCPHCGHQVPAGRRLAAGYHSQTCKYCKQRFYAQVTDATASEEGENTP